MLATTALAIAVIGLWLESQEERPLGGFTGVAALALAVALLVGAVVLPTVSQVEFGFPVGMRIVAAARTREEDLHQAFLGQKGDLELYAHLMCDDADTAAELVEAAWADAARTWRGPPTPALRTCVLCILVQLMLAHSKWRPGAPTMSADSSPLSTLATEAPLPPNDVQVFRATAIYSDHTTQDISDDVAWASSAPATLTIDERGQATAVTRGTVTVTARKGVLRATATVTVSDTPVTLRSITVQPATAELRSDETKAFTAIATYSNDKTQDISGSVNWSSTNPAALTIDDQGLATARKPGDSTVTALFGSQRATARVTVKTAQPVVTDVQVTPAGLQLCNAGTTKQLDATAVYDNGETVDLPDEQVLWSSDNTAVAGVNETGLVKRPADAVDDDHAIISATYQGIVGTASVGCTFVD